MVSTQTLVLDKRPYKENALLVYGISPDCGRLSLVVNKAQRISRSGEFAGVDLYREFDVSFSDSGAGTLFTATELELTGAFDSIAENPRNFKMTGRIAHFLLKNIPEGVPMPFCYDALRNVLAHLAGITPDSWTLEQCAVVIKMVFLYENGMLPEQPGKQQEFIESLISSGIECLPLPECKPEYYQQLNNWLNTLIEYNHLEK